MHQLADVLDLADYLVHMLLRGDPLGLGKLLDLDAMLVRTGQEEYIIALHSLISRYGIGEHHFVGVANVRLSGRIGNGRGDVIRLL